MSALGDMLRAWDAEGRPSDMHGDATVQQFAAAVDALHGEWRALYEGAVRETEHARGDAREWKARAEVAEAKVRRVTYWSEQVGGPLGQDIRDIMNGEDDGTVGESRVEVTRP